MIFNGVFVNPIEIGTSAIYNHPISKKIQEIAKNDDDAVFICLDSIFVVSNFVLANGAKTLSATNFYPDFEKFKIIDKENKYEDIYNRYANQQYCLIDGENIIELVASDSIKIFINPNTLKELKVTYIISIKDYRELLNNYGIDYILVFSQDGYCIYKLSY